MKQIIVKKNALHVRSNRYLLLDKPATLEAVKISDAQAAVFKNNLNFDLLLSLYGEGNQLRLGEEYTGYVVIIHKNSPELYHLNGKLLIEGQMAIFNTELNPFIETRRVLKVEGSLESVVAFNCCSNNLLYSAKMKLTDGLLYNKPIELTDEEDKNLREFFRGRYSQFFLEI